MLSGSRIRAGNTTTTTTMKTNQELIEQAETLIREVLHRHDRELEGLPRAHGDHAMAHLREMWRALDGHADVMPPMQVAKLHAMLGGAA